MQTNITHSITGAAEGEKGGPYIEPRATVKKMNAPNSIPSATVAKKSLPYIESSATVKIINLPNSIPNATEGIPNLGTGSGSFGAAFGRVAFGSGIIKKIKTSQRRSIGTRGYVKFSTKMR